MSEDEYEYEDMEEEEEEFQYTDEEEEQDDAAVALENAYYNAKGLRETGGDPARAAEAFEQVIEKERREEGGRSPGQWSYKALKQLVKLHLRAGSDHATILGHYRRLLDCISNPSADISPAAVEKGINSMLERVASLYQTSSSSSSQKMKDPEGLALAVYDATLRVFHPQTGGPCKNERLWFKTNLKYGQLLYERNETTKLQGVLRELQLSTAESSSQTNSMEIYALQIQLYSRQRDTKKLRETFGKAMAVRGGIPHPRTVALIQELGGKMHMAAAEYEEAGKTFFQAFKSYDEAGDPSRLRCLKYLVLASMLHASSINPFDSQEARPYRDDPEITAMTALVQAFHSNDIQQFERILRQNQGKVMEDEFIREHVEDLLRTIRTQVLRRVIRPYRRISLRAISAELNDIPVADVEQLLVNLILDGSLDGRIDLVAGVLLKQPEKGSRGGGAGESSSSTKTGAHQKKQQDSVLVQKCQTIDKLVTMLDDLSTAVTSQRLGGKETTPATIMRGMISH